MKKHVWQLKGRILSRTFERTNLLQAINLVGGLAAVVGIPLLVFQFMNAAGPDRHWAMVGALVTALGVVLLLIRHGRILDGRTRQLTSWWGVLVPCWRQVGALEQARVVEITLQTAVVRGGKGPSHVNEYYDVTLLGGGKPLRLDRFLDDPEEARWAAESASRALRVRYRDRTVVPVVEKTADQLDESLGQRFLRTGERPSEPRQPAGCRAVYRSLAEGLEVHIPRAGLADPWREAGPGLFMAVLLPLLVIYGKNSPWQVAVPLGVVVAALSVALPVRRAWQADRLTETLRLTPQSLRVESSLYGNHEIPLSQLEELVLRDLSADARHRETQAERYFRHGFLCARSDQVQARFGGALEGVELEYVRDLLLQRIAAWAQ